jgi:hypothetical protein
MADPFFQLSLAELEGNHFQWEKKRHVFWSSIATRPELANGIGNLRWLETRVFCERTHPFQRRRKAQSTDGVAHRPETHPGWIADVGTANVDTDTEDGEAREFRRCEPAQGQPLSLHLGATVLIFSHGRSFFEAVSRTLAFTCIQCMPNHPMHSAYMEQMRRTREADLPAWRGSAGRGLTSHLESVSKCQPVELTPR